MEVSDDDSMSLRRAERRILAYLQDLPPDDVTPAVVNYLASDVEDLMEMEDVEELSEIARKRAKLEVGTNFSRDLVELQRKSANQCINLAVREAINEVLYRKVHSQKKKRTTLMTQREVYFYKVANKKHVVEIQTPSRGESPERRTTATGEDPGHVSVLRDVGRPSVGLMGHPTPLLTLSPRQMLEPPEQSAASPRLFTPGLDVPATSISAYSVPLIPGPPEDLSVEAVLVPPISRSEQGAVEKSLIVATPTYPGVEEGVAYTALPIQPGGDEEPTRAANVGAAAGAGETPRVAHEDAGLGAGETPRVAHEDAGAGETPRAANVGAAAGSEETPRAREDAGAGAGKTPWAATAGAGSGETRQAAREDFATASGEPIRRVDTAERTFRTPVSVTEDEVRSPLRVRASQPAFLAEDAGVPFPHPPSTTAILPETPAQVASQGRGAVVPETPSPGLERPSPVAIPQVPTVADSAGVPIAQEITTATQVITPSSEIQLMLEEIQPSQIPRRSVGRRGMDRIIIDQEIMLRDYASRAIHLNNRGDANRSRLDVTTVVAKRYRHAMSSGRLFVTPACSSMFNPVRGRALTAIFERNLVTEVEIRPTACRVSATVPTPPRIMPTQLLDVPKVPTAAQLLDVPIGPTAAQLLDVPIVPTADVPIVPTADVPIVPTAANGAQPAAHRDSTLSGLDFSLDETLARCRYEAPVGQLPHADLPPLGPIIAAAEPKSGTPQHDLQTLAAENLNRPPGQPSEVQQAAKPVDDVEVIAPAEDGANQHRLAAKSPGQETTRVFTTSVGGTDDTVTTAAVTATSKTVVAISATVVGVTQKIVQPSMPDQDLGESVLQAGPDAVTLEPETVSSAVTVTAHPRTMVALRDELIPPQSISTAVDEVIPVTAPPQNVTTPANEAIPVNLTPQNIVLAAGEAIALPVPPQNVVPAADEVLVTLAPQKVTAASDLIPGQPAPLTPADGRRISDPQSMVLRKDDSFRPTTRPPPRKELKNSSYVLDTMKELWSTHKDVPIAHVLGLGVTKSDVCSLMATLLRLNGEWLVRLYKKDDSLWVTSFSEGHMQLLREEEHLTPPSASF